MPASSPVEDENVAVQLDEVDVVESIGQGVGVPREQADQVIVADVARRHEEQSSRRPRQQMSIDEVTIVRDDDPILDLCNSGDLAIRGSVAIRQFRRAGASTPLTSVPRCESE